MAEKRPSDDKLSRLQRKSERISKKGEAIAKKNSKYFPDVPVVEVKTEAAAPSPVVEEPAVADTTPPDGVVATMVYKESTFGAAAILSAISVVLLLAVLFGVMFGILPTSQANDPSYIQISGGNTQSSFTDDSEMIADFINSVVVVSVERSTGNGTGTGIIVTQNGYIVTNYHVVEAATSIYVKLYGSAQYVKATLINYRAHDDIAVLKIDKTGLRPATFVADSNTCKVGQRVYAIGAPEGTDYSWSVTQGIISSVNRDLKIYDNSGTLEKKMRMIQTDASVNPGNSGGPIINAAGEVVGIVTMKLQDSAGMGFALPSDGVLPIIQAIIDKGSSEGVESTIVSGRPLIGITCVSVQKDTWYRNTEEGIEVVTEGYALSHPKSTFYAEEDGVYVKFTSEGMDAHGKLLAGDIITKIDGTRVYTQYQLMAVLNEHRGGDTVTITYYRNGKYNDVKVSLKEAEIK